jgi:hypothetical protein
LIFETYWLEFHKRLTLGVRRLSSFLAGYRLQGMAERRWGATRPAKGF